VDRTSNRRGSCTVGLNLLSSYFALLPLSSLDALVVQCAMVSLFKASTNKVERISKSLQ
jgi:hypothetical protein